MCHTHDDVGECINNNYTANVVVSCFPHRSLTVLAYCYHLHCLHTGWLKTVDQYYLGANNSIQHAAVKYVLTTVMVSQYECVHVCAAGDVLVLLNLERAMVTSLYYPLLFERIYTHAHIHTL